MKLYVVQQEVSRSGLWYNSTTRMFNTLGDARAYIQSDTRIARFRICEIDSDLKVVDNCEDLNKDKYVLCNSCEHVIHYGDDLYRLHIEDKLELDCMDITFCSMECANEYVDRLRDSVARITPADDAYNSYRIGWMRKTNDEEDEG